MKNVIKAIGVLSIIGAIVFFVKRFIEKNDVSYLDTNVEYVDPDDFVDNINESDIDVPIE